MEFYFAPFIQEVPSFNMKGAGQSFAILRAKVEYDVGEERFWDSLEMVH